MDMLFMSNSLLESLNLLKRQYNVFSLSVFAFIKILLPSNYLNYLTYRKHKKSNWILIYNMITILRIASLPEYVAGKRFVKSMVR